MNNVNNYCKNCDARCCYDGVYLSEIDEKKINDVVSKNKEFFSFSRKISELRQAINCG